MSRPTGVRVTPFAAGWARLPHAAYQRPPGPAGAPRALAASLATPPFRWPRIALPVFLLEHPDHAPVLVDCGPPAAPARADLGPFWGTVFRHDEPEPLPAQLAAAGVDLAEVETVVVTHTHYDHVGGSFRFPGARFVVHPDEDADPPSPTKGTWAAHRDVPGWTPTPFASGPVGPWATSHDLLGDGSVVLVPTPGHTPGHVSVLLRLADGRRAVLTGDAAYRRSAVVADEVPLLCPDVTAYRASLAKLRAWSFAEPGTAVVAGHEPDGWAAAVRELAGSAA